MADDATQGTPLGEKELGLLLGSGLQLGRGRRASPVRVAYSRDLTVEDLLKMSTTSDPVKPIPVSSIRQSHHQLARLLAQGKPYEEIHSILGTYTPSRISILKSDPMVSRLIEYYRGMEAEQYTLARADMHERLANLGFDSLEVLHERIIEHPEEFDNKTLLAVVEAAADRTGHGKTSTVDHKHVLSLSSGAIEKIKSATLQGRPLAEEDRGSLLRIAAERTAEVYSDAEEAEWSPVAGSGVREEGGATSEGEVPSSGLELSPVDNLRG